MIVRKIHLFHPIIFRLGLSYHKRERMETHPPPHTARSAGSTALKGLPIPIPFRFIQCIGQQDVVIISDCINIAGVSVKDSNNLESRSQTCIAVLDKGSPFLRQSVF